MTKTLKNTLLIILSVVLVFIAGFFAFPAYADQPVEIPAENLDDNNNGLDKDGNVIKGNMAFAWTAGAAISGEDTADGENFSTGRHILGFQLNLTSAKHQKLLNFADNVNNTLFGVADELSTGYYDYRFTVYRVKDDETAIPLEEIRVLLNYTGSTSAPRLRRIVMRKPITIAQETTNTVNFYAVSGASYLEGIADYPYRLTKDNASTFEKQMVAAYYKAYIDKGYDVLFYEETENAGLMLEDKTKLSIGIQVQSPYQEYFINFEYKYKVITSDPLVGATSYGTPTSCRGCARSDIRSIESVLKAMDADGALEDVMAAYFPYEKEAAIQEAQNILNNVEVKTVKFTYLKQIDGTPFAAKLTETVTVPVVDGQRIFLGDVAAILGEETLSCMNSHARQHIEFNETTQTYALTYLDAVWLRAITEDGKYVDYFFDVNKSYEQTYKTFVEDELMQEGLYEYQFNNLISAYPALSTYGMDEVYGYFGVIFIPEAATLDNALYAMFGQGTNETGLSNYFEWQENLSLSAYNKLLDDYGYGWLTTLWSNIFNVAGVQESPATGHLFYCDGADRTSYVIGKGGQDDPEDGGVIEDTAGDVVSDVGGFFVDAWEFIKSPFNAKFNILGFGLIAVAVIVVIRLIKRAGKHKPRRKKKR